MRARPDPVPARMSGRSVLVRGVAAVAVFAVAFAVGNKLGDDDPATPSPVPAAENRAASSEVREDRTKAPLGSLRLERAPALPDLRAEPVARRPEPAAAPARPAETAPRVDSEEAPASDGGYSPPAPEPYTAPPAPSNPAPSTPANPPPPDTNAPQPASPTPAPDPAPAPAPAPTPDPSPSGGSGQYAGP
ncbi:MAG TPA: hypothetical protein VG126_18580 [Thermoleophilaceae bacterium]|nr:hypothetical protein [Thermoleophilaceae bacterium]